MILRLFYDLGYVENNNHAAESLEANRFLSSVGVGAWRCRFRATSTCGWTGAFPLSAVDDQQDFSRPVTVGTSHLSFVAVLTY